MRYLYEMHFHTSEVSRCAEVPAREGVRALKKAGYTGVCVTDHFHASWLKKCGDIPYPEKIERWLAGYRAARASAPEGFYVILGMELRLPRSSNEYLIYGLDETLLKSTPSLAFFTPENCSAFADEHGLFMAQAHPFRPQMTRCKPALLHGVEVYNGNIRHINQNRLARDFARRNRLTAIAGSDFHKYEDTGRGGVWFKEKHESGRALSAALLAGQTAGLLISD